MRTRLVTSLNKLKSSHFLRLEQAPVISYDELYKVAAWDGTLLGSTFERAQVILLLSTALQPLTGDLKKFTPEDITFTDYQVLTAAIALDKTKTLACEIHTTE